MATKQAWQKTQTQGQAHHLRQAVALPLLNVSHSPVQPRLYRYRCLALKVVLTAVSPHSHAHHNRFTPDRRLCTTFCSSICRKVLSRSHFQAVKLLIWCVYEGKTGTGHPVKQLHEGSTTAGAQPVPAAQKIGSTASMERQPTKKRPVPLVSKCCICNYNHVAFVSAGFADTNSAPLTLPSCSGQVICQQHIEVTGISYFWFAGVSSAEQEQESQRQNRAQCYSGKTPQPPLLKSACLSIMAYACMTKPDSEHLCPKALEMQHHCWLWVINCHSVSAA